MIKNIGKKIVLISILTLGTSLFAQSDIGVRIQAPIGNGNIDIGFRSDDQRYDKRYKHFNYKRDGYYDNYGYYFGYFDRTGYFFNNIFFLYNHRYTYHDRLHRIGFFNPHHAHFRKYKHHRKNDWNKKHKYRKNKEPIYGHYYDR